MRKQRVSGGRPLDMSICIPFSDIQRAGGCESGELVGLKGKGKGYLLEEGMKAYRKITPCLLSTLVNS